MNQPRTIAVVTGSRAEYGLLVPVMRAIDAHEALKLQIIVTGTHLLGSSPTADEVVQAFPDAVLIPMQREGEAGRLADAASLGRGMAAVAEHFAASTPDVVVVLGDRIEAFAAAAAASVAGIRVAHLHGGDRAVGIADDALRHAITKLAHLHLPATAASAQRLERLGERSDNIHCVGSPGIDDLRSIPALDDAGYEQLGSPKILFLLHPVGDDDETEQRRAEQLLDLCTAHSSTLALHPNHDAGREGIVKAIDSRSVHAVAHLPRQQFISLCHRASVIVGNSSAGLIECAAIGLPCLNLGVRQHGRETPPTVQTIADWNFDAIKSALDRALNAPKPEPSNIYGNGNAGPATANILATFDPAQIPLAKCNTF